MTEPEELDLDQMSTAWRAQEVPAGFAAAMAQRIRTQTRLMWLSAVLELAVLVVLVPFTAWFARAGIAPAEIVVLGAIWLLALAAMVFSLWNRRGSWRAPAEHPAAYVELAERRARAKLRVAMAVRGFAVAQAAAVTALVAVAPDSSIRRTTLAAALAIVLALGYVLWSLWYAARGRRELDEALRARKLLHWSSAEDTMSAT